MRAEDASRLLILGAIAELPPERRAAIAKHAAAMREQLADVDYQIALALIGAELAAQ